MKISKIFLILQIHLKTVIFFSLLHVIAIGHNIPFTDDSDKKTDENSNNARELTATTNENLSDQNNGKHDQKQDKPMAKQSNEESMSSQNTKDTNTQLQFRPINMFNSPPPGFIRPPPGPPPLLNPSFFPPPNRFWGNTPPGMNMNQNKTFQSQNRWSSPSNFERQRFNRPPPDFGIESRPNRRVNNDEDGDSNVRGDEVDPKLDDIADEESENFDDPIDDDESNQAEQSNLNQNNSAPKRQNPFSQMPRIPANEEKDFVQNQAPNKPNNIGRPLRDDLDQQPRFNMFRQGTGMQPNDGPSNSQQSPVFSRSNSNSNQQFNNQNFNNQIGPFNQTPTGPQPLFSPQNMNFNSPMRGRGGIRGESSPYFRPRGRGGPVMNMNRGNFRPNFRGNNNRGNW